MTEQNTNQPIADDNSVSNDSTKAETNESQGIPKARLDEVVAQKHKATERGDSYKAQFEELQAKQEAARKKDLEKQGEYKTLLDEANTKIEKLSVVADEYTTYKTNKRASLMETITNDDDKSIADGLSDLNKLETYVNKVVNVNAPSTSQARATTGSANDMGGYSSWEEFAMKDPKGAEKAIAESTTNFIK